MRDSINWSAVETAYGHLEPHRDSLPFLRGEISTRLLDFDPLDLDKAASYKLGTTLFFLLAVESALADHLLNDAEIEDLENAKRILRIHEGDLLKFHEQRIRSLLCREIQLLLGDLEITPEESLHKARLQQLLGLGYDEFSELVAREIQRIIATLLTTIGVASLSELTPEGKNWIRIRLNALDLIFKISQRTHVASIQNYPDFWPREIFR